MIESVNGDIIQWLRGFYHIAHTGSIRRASEVMNRTPSTLSYQLRCLEEELGTVLFDRDGRGLKITPEGEKLMAWTISTFEALNGMKSELSARPGNLQGKVIFSAALPIATRIVSTVSEFHHVNPKVRIDIRRGMADGIISDVEDAVSDFGLLSTAVPPADCDFEELFTSRTLLILPRENDYGLSERPSIEELSRLPFVAYLESSNRRQHSGFAATSDVDSFCRTPPVLRVNNYHLMIHYVMQGMGAALLDEVCLHGTFYGGVAREHLQIVPLDHIFPNMHHGLLLRKRKRLSPQARELARCLCEALRA